MSTQSVVLPGQRSTGPSFGALAMKVAPWAVGLFALLILLIVQSGQAQLGVYWLLGLALGTVLQRGRFCFAGAFRDLHLMRNGTYMKAIIGGLAVASIGFALIQARQVPAPEFGAIPPGAHVIPLGLPLIVGGLAFGIGMVVAGGCVSGTLYRIGEGYLASWASLAGILIGLVVAANTWNFWYTTFIEKAPKIWLPATFGYGGALALTLGLLGLSYIGILYWESRGGGFTPAAGAKKKAPVISFRDRLAAIKGAVLGKGWPAPVAAVGLAGLNITSYEINHPIGVTGELAAWADRAAALVGLPSPVLLGADALAGCNLVLEKLGLLTPYTMLDAGLVVGALLAALAAGEFKLRIARNPVRYVQSASGGVMMGFGAGIAVGCTLGAFFAAIPSFGLNGWVFGLALFGGAWIGTQIIKRIA